jgi:branched-chain amino acid transport system ATP-binding protein
MLTLTGVCAGYGGNTVLRNVDFAVGTGEVVALLGPNSAGKSTLLKTATGFLPPTEGSIEVDNVDFTHARPHTFARSGVCHLPEGRGIFPSLSVRENLAVQIRNVKVPDSVEQAVALFPFLERRITVAAGSLSGGEQQMLALCRAYLTQPKVVLIDEPSLGLAPLIVDQIFEALRNLVKQGVGLVLVEQYVQRAVELADRVYVLSRGEVIHSGPASEVDAAEIYERYLGFEP